jgi:pimeloyl-ACP methyl ester carboxylesterase
MSTGVTIVETIDMTGERIAAMTAVTGGRTVVTIDGIAGRKLDIPMKHRLIAACSALAALVLVACAPVASVSAVRPNFKPVSRLTGELVDVDQRIVAGLKRVKKQPIPALGEFLASAESAAAHLQRHPKDPAAREAYNFAVARVFTAIHDGDLDPWTHPLRVPSAGGDFTLTRQPDPRPQYNPALYDLTPADQIEIKGTYLTTRSRKEGLGAPLVAVGKELRKDARETFGPDRVYYGVTAVVRFEKGRRCVVSFVDPLAHETVQYGGRSYPLAADFTAPLAVMLVRENPERLNFARLLQPERYEETARIARLQPYDPNKAVVLVVHGLASSPATWTPAVNSWIGDPDLRQRYQFWFFSYPSGYPYPYAAALLRKELNAIEAKFPLRHKMVIVGHSMGAMISRLMLTDTGDSVWLKTFGKPPAQTPLSPRAKEVLEDSLIFAHRREIGRAIFVCGPHRGSDLASNWLARFGASLVRSPKKLIQVGPEMFKLMTADTSSLHLNRLPNSVDTLAPNNRFVKAINTLPLTPSIPYHTIVGDRGRGDTPNSSDGFVPYWSSHLDGAKSEKIVPSNHSAQQNPEGIAEMRRIFRLHAGLPAKD